MDISRQLDFLSHADRTTDERLAFFVDMMRELSSQTDPQEMVRAYGQRMEQVVRRDRYISLSRRDLPSPKYRVTRSSVWDEAQTNVNPWRNKDALPVFETGLLGELLYRDLPTILDDFTVDPSDPGYVFLEGMRSLVALPLFDKGVATNMVIMLSKRPNAFDRNALPEQVWMSNLFGRATHNLVLRDELQRAYNTVDREMQVVADIQRSLLPTVLPQIPTLDIAAYYQTSRRAGGDYYDFFPLPDGKWGILLADVSGHGTPAAVLMAVTHSIAHTHNGPPDPPSGLLQFINAHLTERYTNDSGKFVTAFYGIYDPSDRSLRYACAGHCPPRIMRESGKLEWMDEGAGLPLGIEGDGGYHDVVIQFHPGDTIVFYTDGITEARGSASNDLFGTDRLDDVLRDCPSGSAAELIDRTLESVDEFTEGRPPTDDRTLLCVRVK
jgi:sigma-B regulation protein RsbU (phosphoserine phosphatase)